MGGAMVAWTRAVVVVGVLAVGAALADGLPALPAGLQLPRGADSPGAVTFNHDMHVDAEKPRCLGCHPRPFRILGRSAAGSRPASLEHRAMEKGQACGACHGKGAFGFDECAMCHTQ
jgi:c(7)-type cytochrome triheme protein